MTNPKQQLWESMKAKGFFQNYKTYSDYSKAKEIPEDLAISKEPEQLELEDSHSPEYLQWKDKIPKEEREDYNFVFDEK